MRPGARLLSGEGYYLYICSPTSPQPNSLSPSGPWPWPHADSGTRVYPPSGTDIGSASAQGVSAGFVAFLSTRPGLPGRHQQRVPHDGGRPAEVAGRRAGGDAEDPLNRCQRRLQAARKAWS